MHTAFLVVSSHADPSLLRSNAVLKERSAALKWAQNSFALQEDPALWEADLNPAIFPTLMSLYALPPHHGTGLSPSNTTRLAAQIILFNPAAPPLAPAAAAPQAAPPPPPPPPPAIPVAAAAAPVPIPLPGLNIARPQPGPAPSLPIPPQSSAQPPSQLLPAAPPQPPPPTNARKRPHYMCSNDLLNALPAEVYRVVVVGLAGTRWGWHWR
jgi:hypothetical protein